MTVDSGNANSFVASLIAAESGGHFNARGGSGITATNAKVGGGVGGAQSVAVMEGAATLLRVADTLSIPSRGTVTARGGGMIQVDSTLDVGIGGALRVEAEGMGNIGPGGVGIPGKLRIGPGGTLSGDGQVLTARGVVRSGGNLPPGNLQPGNLQPGNLQRSSHLPGSHLLSSHPPRNHLLRNHPLRKQRLRPPSRRR